MSSPFPLEEAAQTDDMEPVWNPWKEPAKPQWYSGFGFNEETAYSGPIYRTLELAGNATAKGEAVMGGIFGLAGRVYSSVGTPRPVGQELEPIGANITRDARERVKATTPDPATTGAAAQVLNSVGSGAIRFAVGTALGGPAGAATVLGSTESVNRYDELREQGVDKVTAGESAGLAGVTSAAGAFLPAAYGSTFLTRLATGAAGNTAFGVADRFLDHKILEAGGYPEMAEQQKALDGTQMLVDAALGATFGLIHHATHVDADKTDAALTANLALRDRQSAPGVATDPHAANAHQAALEKAQEDLMSGRDVDVSGTDVDKASFLSRPERDLTPESELILKSFKESGLLDEEANLRDLEAQFAQRIGQPAPERESVKPEEAEQPITGFTTAKGSTYEITPSGTTIRNKSVHPEHPGDEGIKPESHRTYYVTPEDADILGEIQTQGGPKRSLAEDGNGNLGLRYKEGPSAGKIERRTVVKDRGKPAVGLTPIETWNNGRDVHFGNEITDLRRESVKPAAAPKGEGYSVQEEGAHEQHIEIGSEAGEPTAGEQGDTGERSEALGERPGSADLISAFRGGQRDVGPGHFTDEALGSKTKHPSSGLGVFFTSSPEEALQWGRVSRAKLDLRNPKEIPAEDLPGFDSTADARAYAKQLEAQGYDGIIVKNSHLGGHDWYVAFRHDQVNIVQPKGDPAKQALEERPNLEITGESGEPVKAADALEQGKLNEDDWFKATKAAADCFGRRGG